jgi:hypothetical protein
VHVKHGIAYLFLGLASLAFAWFRLGPKKAAAQPEGIGGYPDLAARICNPL